MPTRWITAKFSGFLEITRVSRRTIYIYKGLLSLDYLNTCSPSYILMQSSGSINSAGSMDCGQEAGDGSRGEAREGRERGSTWASCRGGGGGGEELSLSPRSSPSPVTTVS